MSLRMLGTGLILLLTLIGGCHSSQSRYQCVQSSPCPTPCNTCNSPPPPGTITAVPGGHGL
jgi:hypothetical protein